MSFDQRLDSFLAEVVGEVAKARAKHRPMASAHEGRSVIREECDELFDHVRADTGDSLDARKEAKQIAAMGIRYVMDVCGGGDDSVDYVARGVRAAALRVRLNRPLSSAHEGHAYIMDHYATLFARVAEGAGSGAMAHMSAYHIAGAAINYALDLCADVYDPTLSRDSGDESKPPCERPDCDDVCAWDPECPHGKTPEFDRGGYGR